MTEDYNKPLKPVYEIEGVDDRFELIMAGDILLKVYHLACEVTNNGGIEKFNSYWDKNHPDYNYKDEYDEQDEYIKAYEHYFKSITDSICEQLGSPYRLKESEPVLLNFKEGWFKIRGYKEHQ